MLLIYGTIPHSNGTDKRKLKRRPERSGFVTFEDVGHCVLGLSWQNRTEVKNKLWRTKVNNQLPETITARTDIFIN